GAKPHGALYHAAAYDAGIAAAFLDAIVAVCANDLPELAIVGPPEGQLGVEARARRLVYAREGFADRRYGANGKLLPRSEPGGVLFDPEACAEQAVAIARTGDVETICVHGDTPNAAFIARTVRDALEREGL